MTYYKQHIFVCTNQKPAGKTCCANSGGETFFLHLKQKINAHNLAGQGKVRISKSGCLGRCDLGPCMVIYPEGQWYTYQSIEDIDEIVEQYLLAKNVVTRLVIQENAVE